MRRESDQPQPTPGAPGQPGAAGHEPDIDSRALQKERQARVVKVLIALGLAVILIIFIVSNSKPVDVDFVFVTRHPRLIWVMFACSVIGGIIGYLIGKPGKQVRLHRKKDEPGNRS
jgi:uncharacterized integral membrane protein